MQKDGGRLERQGSEEARNYSKLEKGRVLNQEELRHADVIMVVKKWVTCVGDQGGGSRVVRDGMRPKA
jgi:hypothetical protein